MPNLATALRAEITRLARKENRGELSTLKATVGQQRHAIAALKRDVADLQRQVKALSHRATRQAPATAEPVAGAGLRFSAKGLAQHRKRLGLSAANFGRLLGVSAVTVYAWEAGRVTPQRAQLAKVAAARRLGKREAARLLAG